MGLGRLCRTSVNSLTTTYAYNGFGYRTDQTQTLSGGPYTTHTDRDPWGRVTGMTYPGGRTVTTTRDARGRIATVSATVGGVLTPLITGRTYRADDQIASQTFGNGLVDSRIYTDAGRLTNQFIGTVDTRVYSYDDNDNLTGKQSLPENATYTYNYLDQLTADNDPTPLTLGYYGNNGNRTSLTGTTTTVLTYLPNSNALATVGGQTINLSPNGNIRNDPARGLQFNYNNANDLGTVFQNGVFLASYTYDPQHLRVSKVSPDGMTLYHYDDTGHLLQETDSIGTLIRAYVWADDLPIAEIIKTATGERLLYLHTDNLNTPRLGTGPAGVVRWRWEGNAFGDDAPNEDPTYTGVPTTVNLRYAGQYYDKETGLHYNWNRYYDPRLGRYITSDPVGLEGGLNTYSYVGNNPLYWVDPLGLAVQICRRPADIANGIVDHYWVTTGSQSVGLGGDPNIRPGDQVELPIITKTFPIDHSKDTPTSCEVQNNVNESCVNDILSNDLGKNQGGFGPTSNCKQFAFSVVNRCRTGPQIPPSPPRR